MSIKRDDKICVRLGYRTKTDLQALAQALDVPVSELIREYVRKMISENEDKINEELSKGVKQRD